MTGIITLFCWHRSINQMNHHNEGGDFMWYMVGFFGTLTILVILDSGLSARNA